MGLPTLLMLKTTLIEFPRYHADNTGYPLPLPLKGFEHYIFNSYYIAHVVVPLLISFAATFVAILAIKAREKRLWLEGGSNRFFLIVMGFYLLHLKTGLDRCDPGHLAFVFAPLSLPIVFDCATRLVGWSAPCWRRLATGGVVGLVYFGILAPHVGTLGWVGTLHIRQWAGHAWDRATHAPTALPILAQCLTPTRQWSDILEPSFSAQKTDVQKGIREIRRITAHHGLGPRQLLAVHSGPLVYPLLGHATPTKYYLLGWAMNDDMEREAVAELKANGLRSILRLNGVGSTIGVYDVPDEHRIPIIHGYLESTSAPWSGYVTTLGSLFVQSSADAYRVLHAEGDDELLQGEGQSYALTPNSLRGVIDDLKVDDRYVQIAGWAADPEHDAPAEAVLVAYDNVGLFYAKPHAERADVATYFGKSNLVPCGFHVVLPRSLVRDCSPGALRVLAIRAGQATELQWPAQATLAARP
jgi:hypothetical protein